MKYTLTVLPKSLCVEKQHFPIYDRNVIVAVVGGSLGLLLSFSCHEVARDRVSISE